MKTLFLSFILLLSTNVYASKVDLVWAIKVNTQLVNRSLLELNTRVQRTEIEKLEQARPSLCFEVGLLVNNYQLKRAITNTYELQKFDKSLGRELNDLLYSYIQKEIAELKLFCTNNQDKEYFNSKTNYISYHLNKTLEKLNDAL